MIISYDIKKLHQMLKDFHHATGINMDFLKADCSYVGNRDFWEKKRYCKAIQSTEAGRKACLDSDSCLLKKSRESKKLEMHVCHSGLIDVSLPVLYHDLIIGYVIFGQIKKDTDFSKLENYMKNLGLDTGELKQYYDELNVFDEEQIQSISNIAEMLVKHILLENTFQPFDENISRALAYIHENLEKELSVQGISQNVNVSKSVLYRMFHRYFGCTLSQYINKKRIEKSTELLSEGNISIEEIAIKTGFSSGSYFSKTFKKEKGLTPLQYKKKIL